MVLKRFSDRVAILSGATQGIGLATAKRLGQEGCKVVVSSRRQENVDSAVDYLQKEGIEASGIASNQRIKEDRQRLIKHTCDRYGGFDCLFISAGVNPHFGCLLEATEDSYDKDLGMYIWSKLCLVAMTQHVSRDCFDLNIRVTCIAPEAIRTRFYDTAVSQGLDHVSSMLESVDAMQGKPTQRVGEPDEIAATVAYLLSDDASYVTGNCIIPCGGFPFNRAL